MSIFALDHELVVLTDNASNCRDPSKLVVHINRDGDGNGLQFPVSPRINRLVSHTYHHNDNGAMSEREEQAASHWQLAHSNETSRGIVDCAVKATSASRELVKFKEAGT